MGLLLGGTGPGSPLHPGNLVAQNGLPFALRCLGHLHALRLQGQEALIISLVAVELSLVQLHNAAHHAVQEVPVMGNHKQGAPEGFQIFLQPVSHTAVQMVGGLVQYQKIRCTHKHTG